MKFVIQRVLNSKVNVDGKTIGSIYKGFMVLLGIADTEIVNNSFILLSILH